MYTSSKCIFYFILISCSIVSHLLSKLKQKYFNLILLLLCFFFAEEHMHFILIQAAVCEMLSCLHVSVCSQTQFSVHKWDEIFTVAHRIVWLTEWKNAEVQGPLCLEVRCGLPCWSSVTCTGIIVIPGIWKFWIPVHFGWQAARRNLYCGHAMNLKKYINYLS